MSSSPRSSSDPKLVLIVDDEPLIATTLVAILNLCDGEFGAVSATSVADAVTIVRGIKPDLVLLDVMMPGVERLEHALEIRDECSCNVLLMSGAGQTTKLLEEVVAAGHSTFEIVPKPIHPRELIEKVREVLGRRNPLQFRAQSQGKS